MGLRDYLKKHDRMLVSILVAGVGTAVIIQTLYEHDKKLNEFMKKEPATLSGFILSENYQRPIEHLINSDDPSSYSFVLRDPNHGIVEIDVSDNSGYSKESFESAVMPGCYIQISARQNGNRRYIALASDRLKINCS